jgi:hypothetical protein
MAHPCPEAEINVDYRVTAGHFIVLHALSYAVITLQSVSLGTVDMGRCATMPGLRQWPLHVDNGEVSGGGGGASAAAAPPASQRRALGPPPPPAPPRLEGGSDAADEATSRGAGGCVLLVCLSNGRVCLLYWKHQNAGMPCTCASYQVEGLTVN